MCSSDLVQWKNHKHFFLTHAHTGHFGGLLGDRDRPNSLVTYLGCLDPGDAETKLFMHKHTFAALKLYVQIHPSSMPQTDLPSSKPRLKIEFG